MYNMKQGSNILCVSSISFVEQAVPINGPSSFIHTSEGLYLALLKSISLVKSLHLLQVNIVLITTVLLDSFKSGNARPPIFFRIAQADQGVLEFYTNFSSIYSMSLKNVTRIMKGIRLNLQNVLGNMFIFNHIFAIDTNEIFFTLFCPLLYFPSKQFGWRQRVSC